jgi:signal peptidase I
LETADEKDIPETRPKKSTAREYAEAIAVALVIALFIRSFVVQAFKIPSGSMIPTLLVGDHLLVSRFSYGIRNPVTGALWIDTGGRPHRGDIVVFRYPLNPSQDFIKRVIGLPGDTIEIVDKRVYINGELYKDEHAVHYDPRIIPGDIQPRDNFGPITVPEGKLFVMGDNRDNSYDSRFWKFVDIRAVKGRAFILYWSWDSEHFRPRLDRIGKILH